MDSDKWLTCLWAKLIVFFNDVESIWYRDLSIRDFDGLEMGNWLDNILMMGLVWSLNTNWIAYWLDTSMSKTFLQQLKFLMTQ